MRKRRIAIQILILILFLYFIAITQESLTGDFSNPFTRLSPLGAIFLVIIKGSIALIGGGFILLIIASFIFGRFFCGYICPMGTTIDIGEKALFAKSKKSSLNISRVKYIVLAFIFASALFGFSSVYLFDPVTTAYKFYAFTVFPLVDLLRQKFSSISFGLSSHSISTGYSAAFAAFFLLLFLAGRIEKRFWCRNICPLGAIFALISKASPLVKKTSDKCVKCDLCIKECPMGAIPDDPFAFNKEECIKCFTCADKCPKNAISFGIELSKYQDKKPEPIADSKSGFSRRAFITALLAGAAAGAAVKYLPASVTSHDLLIRPPGSIPESDFNALCIRCGECMKICSAGGLQPVTSQGALSAVMTPVLIPSIGYCAQSCTLCQKVCPTGAIQKFEETDKPYLKIGTAKINKETCIAWKNGADCLVCDEHCVYGAITPEESDGFMVPVVDEKICTGCGFCENKCPIKPAAIKVTAEHNRPIKKEGKTWADISVNKPGSGYPQ